MVRLLKIAIFGTCLILTCVDCHAGLFDWLFGARRIEAIDESKFKASFKKQVHNNIDKAAFQLGEIRGTISKLYADESWMGDVKVTMAADYVVTYGLPFNYLDNEIRFNLQQNSQTLNVFIGEPQILNYRSENFRSISTDVGIFRKAKYVSELRQRFTERECPALIGSDCRIKMKTPEYRKKAKEITHDIVYDIIKELHSRRTARNLAIVIYFNDESFVLQDSKGKG